MRNPFKHIVSTKQAALILGKTERQIRNLCRSGKLKAQLLDPTDPKSPWMIFLPYTKKEEDDDA